MHGALFCVLYGLIASWLVAMNHQAGRASAFYQRLFDAIAHISLLVFYYHAFAAITSVFLLCWLLLMVVYYYYPVAVRWLWVSAMLAAPVVLNGEVSFHVLAGQYALMTLALVSAHAGLSYYTSRHLKQGDIGFGWMTLAHHRKQLNALWSLLPILLGVSLLTGLQTGQGAYSLLIALLVVCGVLASFWPRREVYLTLLVLFLGMLHVVL